MKLQLACNIVLFILSVTEITYGQKTLKKHLCKGMTEPSKYAAIKATVAGRVAVIRKKEGQYVKKGEVILELEKEEEALEVELRKLIADSKVEVTAARYKDSILNIDYLSTKKLFNEAQSVSEEELIKKELEYKLAFAEHKRLEMMEKKETIEYKIASVQLKKRIIVAPFNGVVVKIHFKIAESCTPQDSLVQIADVSSCRFITHLKSNQLSAVKKGDTVDLIIGEGGVTNNRSGTIEFVSPVIEASSGLCVVKAVFDNKDAAIKPGIAGSMRLSGGL